MLIPKGYRIKEGFEYVLEPDGTVPEELLEKEREERHFEAGQACFGKPIPDLPSRSDPDVTDEELRQAVLDYCRGSHDMLVKALGSEEAVAEWTRRSR